MGYLMRTALAATALASLCAQQPAAETVRQGAILFRQECSPCHGVGARGGVRGPDLTTGAWVHGGSDTEIARTITNGVPGTAMSANKLLDTEVSQIVAYLRTLQQTAAPVAGDAHRGEALFFGAQKCSSCHTVNGKGGRLGPDLSYAGSARPRAYLAESIREPNRQLTTNMSLGELPGAPTMLYDTVTAVTADGKSIVGVEMNEDTFTVQMMDTGERIYSLQKKSLKSFKHESRSLMPAYTAGTLNETDLQDVVAYLQSLRAPTAPAEKGGSNAVH
jgi:putative heme-binding domain-containing protein